MLRPAVRTLHLVIGGHIWTLGPFVARTVRVAPPVGAAWTGMVHDDQLGAIRLSGRLSVPQAARGVLVVVHGLGGSVVSNYMGAAARAAHEQGMACLQLNLRGADGSGQDFYHAGLTADLHAAIASPELAGFDDVYVLGYSLGGHLALRYATEAGDPRLRGAAAVCAPIDLDRSATAIDAPQRWAYRRYVLIGLREIYGQVAAHRSVPTPLAQVRRIRTLRTWDDLVVAPRHGFTGAADYYARTSVAPRLDRLRVPALLVEAEHDPMIPAATVLPALAGAPPGLDVRWVSRGGHVGFPRDLDLSLPGPRGLEPQIITWLRGRS